MTQNKPIGETDNCRWRLTRYCQGQGLDIGCGHTKIKPDAIGVDLYNPTADMKMDARDLSRYSDGHFDYIYSSHLLEEIENTEATLRGWLRVLKDDGNIVLYQADKDLYHPIGSPNCNPSHKHHFSWESLWDIFQKIGKVDLVHHGRYVEKGEWSFELVIKKNLTGKKEEIQMNEPEGISFLIPTRKRPKGIEDLTLSIDKVTGDPRNIEIIFGVNEDDKESMLKIDELRIKTRIEIRYEIMKPWPDNKVNLSHLWNQCYKVSKYPILGYFGDDVLFQTPGWDEEVRKEFIRDKNILLNCNDVHVQRGRQATLFFTHKTVHEKMGFYLNERFRRWYADTMLEQIYRYAGKYIYREDIVTEHLHPDAFPDRADETYTRMDGLKNNDTIQWNSVETREGIKKYGEILKRLTIKIEPVENKNIDCHKKLSILILTMVGREKMLKELLDILEKQKTDEIEILIGKDSGENKLGKKRNILLEKATGDYIVFIDDDDMVPNYYISEILKGIADGPDCCSLEGIITFNGSNPKTFKHSIKYQGWYEESDIYYRCPNHWNVVKRSIASEVKFNDNLSNGEDRDYSMRLRPHLKTEFTIDKVLYFFLFKTVPKEYHKHT